MAKRVRRGGSKSWMQDARKRMEEKGTVGSFSRWALSRGMSSREAANDVLQNKSRFSKKRVAQANFARNAIRFSAKKK